MKTAKNIIFQLTLFFLALISTNCSSEKNEKLITTDGNARVIWDKYDNGNEKIVYQYLVKLADDNSDYYYEHFYENGNIKTKGLENQGMKKGEWIYYHENGTLQARVNFTNDTLNGVFVLYDEDGFIKSKSIFIHGYYHGNSLEFESVLRFINENLPAQDQRPKWWDSLYILVDSLCTMVE